MADKRVLWSCLGLGCGAIVVLAALAVASVLLLPSGQRWVRAVGCSWGHATSCRAPDTGGAQAPSFEALAACQRDPDGSCGPLVEAFLFGDPNAAPHTAADFLELACEDRRAAAYRGLSIAGLACRRAAMLRGGGIGGAPDPVRIARLFETGCREGDPVSCREAGERHEAGLGTSSDEKAARSFYEAGCGTLLVGGLATADSAAPPILLSVAADGFDVNGTALATREAVETHLRGVLGTKSGRTVSVGFLATQQQDVPSARVEEAAAAVAAAGGQPLHYVDAVEAHLNGAEACCAQIGRKPALLARWTPPEEALSGAARSDAARSGAAPSQAPREAAPQKPEADTKAALVPPRKLAHVEPVYPKTAVAARLEGQVVLEFTIGVDGRVRDVKVLRGMPLLDEAAIDAVRKWVYAPALVAGVPTPSVMKTTINFNLQESGGEPAEPNQAPRAAPTPWLSKPLPPPPPIE